MKSIALTAFFLFTPLALFAGGGADSGRNTTMDTIEAGQFADPAQLDAYEFINDYEFPYSINPAEDLSVFVRLEKRRALSIGDNFNLLIGLHVNNQNYFKRNEGN